MSFATPKLLNLLFALAGACLGWYLRHRQTTLPPELADLLNTLLERYKEQQAQAALRQLLSGKPPPE